MRILKALSLALLVPSLFSSISFAAQQDRISGPLSNGEAHVLKGNIRHQARPEYDQGRVDPGMQLGTITLMTAPTAEQESAIKLLLAQQQDRKSPNYHKWLTPEQYADRFGLSENDIQKMVAWLAAQGFTMIEPAHGRNFITFTGTAAQVENAFGTEIHHYNVKGELHYANATAPQIPAALAGIVVGMHGLDNFHLKAMNVKRTRPDYFYNGNFSGQFIAPGDIYTMYDITPLLTATPKVDGTGQKVGIVGETQIFESDLNDFRAGFGLSSITCTAPSDIITACSDPHFSYVVANGGPTSVNDSIGESDLDLEWSGAIAPGAQIVFVTAGNVFDALYYAIDNKAAPVISMSFGNCEFESNITEFTAPSYSVLFESELQKANSFGITVVNSSGDTGAAACDSEAGTPPNGSLTTTGLATQGLAVSYPASSQYVTGVGGTAIQFADVASPTYWGTTNGTDGGSLLPNGPQNGYIPEQAWNDDDEFVTYCQQNPGAFCTQGGTTRATGATGEPWVSITSEATAQEDIGLGSGTGGASNCYMQTPVTFEDCVSGFPQPSWQTVTVSGQTTRMVPDIALLATPNFPGFIYCTPVDGTSGGSTCAGGGAAGIANAVGDFSLIGGTSASAPMFAGMVALLNQYTASDGQGNINVSLYQLSATAPSAFHDITNGDNNVACEPGTLAGQPAAILCPSTGVVGYTAGPGFDMATGLGSLDVNKLAVALKNPPNFTVTTTPPTTSLSVYSGQTSSPVTITVTPTNNFSNPVSFSCSGLPTGATCSFSPSTVTPSGAGVTTTATVTGGSATSGSVPITVYGTTGNSSATASHVSNASPAIALTVTSALTSFIPTATSFQVTQGSSVNATATLVLAAGFTGTVSFTCADPAPQSICTVPTPVTASTLPANGQVSFAISTTAPTASLRPPDGGGRIFYAALLPGLFGLMLTAGTRRRSLRGMRFLGLILVMGFSTMWLASCGGSSGGNSNKGTPVGPYIFTVAATSGGATVTSPQFTVNVSQ